MMKSTECINELIDLFQLIAKQDQWNHNLNSEYLQFFFRGAENTEIKRHLQGRYESVFGAAAVQATPQNHIQTDIDSVKTIAGAKRIVKYLAEEDKLIVCALLCEQAKTGDFITSHRTEILEAINSVFALDKSVFNTLRALILENNPYQSADEHTLVIEPEEISLYNRVRGVKHERVKGLDKAIVVKRIAGFEGLLLLKYFGQRKLFITQTELQPGRFYILRSAELLHADGLSFSFEQLNNQLSARFTLDSLQLAGTEKTPKINFNVQSGLLSISGVSIPEDALAFYKPLLHWLGLYMQQRPASAELRFHMEFFNTVSSRLFLEIMKMMQRLKEAGTEVLIRWIYEDGDEDIQEAGENYADMVNVKFVIEAGGD